MTVSHNSGLSLNSSQDVSPATNPHVKRFAYIGMIPILAGLLLVVMFGLMGALPSLVEAQASIWYATPNGSASASCLANDPCALQTAVSSASTGDEVRAAMGTYTSTDPISVTQSISVTGGYIYLGGSNWSNDASLYNITTLDGEDAHRVMEIAADVSPAISNFHIEKGAADNGAGVFVMAGNGRPHITNNIIRNNDGVGGNGGGGIYDGGASIIENNEIYNNTTTGAGGGGGILVDNSTAAISTTIRFNRIHDNRGDGSSSQGGGIFHDTGASALLVANYIYNNTAKVGGGIGASLSTDIVLNSNMIYDNEALGISAVTSLGGGLSTSGVATIWNNTFVGNIADDGGAGIYMEGATAEISNNIVAFNTGNGNDGIDYSGPNPEFITGGFNNVFGDAIDSDLTLTDAVAGNPDFVDLINRNLHINETSPALNAGDLNTPAWIDLDIDQQTRPNPDPAYDEQDVGADEYYVDFASFEIAPPVTNNIVERGDIEVFTHTIQNVGTVEDRYDIACASDTFTMTFCATQTVSVTAGSSTQLTTSVEIPTNMLPYEVGVTTITATSQVSNTLSEAAIVRSTIALHPGISFTPNISRTELPGEIITLTHVITNDGDAFDSFTITEIEDTNGWAILLPQDPLTISLNAGVAQNVQVQIEVPDFAPQGLSNIVRIEAVSVFDPSISATVVETITAKATTGTRYVSTVGDDGDNNCTQLDMSCRTVAHAVGQVAAGDEVRVAPGLYTESGIDVNDTIHISGGWDHFGNNGQGDEPDPKLTVIDANNVGQIFVIGAGNSTVSDLTLRQGFGSNGGAVFVNNPAQSEFNNIIFEDNTAANRGGAVYMNSGTAVSVKNSYFIENQAGLEGGAFYMAGGTLSINQSRFLTNTATTNGGGGFGMNSGILSAQNNLFHNNDTNSSGGGVRLNGGTANFNFNTWVENSAGSNGGGVYNHGADATIENSLFADNAGSNGSAISENTGNSTTSFDYLLFSPGQDANMAGSYVEADPLFGDDEFRLGLGSPAIDTADPNATLTVDFENDFRPSDEGHDIGYDERAGCRAMRDETIYGSIQDAVDVTGAESDLIKVSGICRGVHTIDVGGSVISQTVHLTKSVLIQGGWDGGFNQRTMEPTIVDPEQRGRGFLVMNGISVTVEAISVTNGMAIDLGGTEPITGGAGGGIYNVDGNLTLRGVTIVSGMASVGGGFYNEGGFALLTWELLTGEPDVYFPTQIFTNTADSGAGIFNDIGNLTVDGSTLSGNQARLGGGLFNQTGMMTVVNTILDRNIASEDGGGIYNEAVTATVAHNTFYSNTASLNGGGVFDDANALVVDSNIFESNQATTGSAIFASDTGTLADYNYYYDNSGTAVSGTDAGLHSIESATPPGLVDPPAGDFHLEDNAPAVDVGNPMSLPPVDFEGDPRPSNQGFDIGADEVVGCLVMLNDVVYGSLQAAIDDALPGDEIYVSGTCSGVHSFDTGNANACGGDAGQIQTAVHITKNVNLLGGWDEGFNNRLEYSVLDANTLGRVLYIGPGVTSTIDGFEMINGLLTGLEANGAGICIDQASPTIQNNHIYSNTAADDGGGIYSFNSTPFIQNGNHIYENEADNGGGIYIDVESGNVFTSSLHNNFIYKNLADNGGGVYANRGAHSILHNTVVSNTATTDGGGFYMSADASGGADIRGQIIMNNTGGGVYGAGTISPSLSYNDYYQNVSGNFGGNATDDFSTSIAVDPMFYNPISNVFTITIDSPVVDIDIPDMLLVEDYEGDIRPSHQGYDLGADEVGGCFAIIQSSPSTVYGSVQRAVDLASDGDTILVDGICQNVNSRMVTSNQVSQTVVFTKSVTIDGSWDYDADTSTVTTTLDALNRGRVVYVAPGENVTITNIILENGAAVAAGNGDDGGGIYNAGTLNLNGVWVQKNTAVSGAGIYNEGDLVVAETAVLTNTAQEHGGGLYNNGSATITGNEFRHNIISQNGGGIYQNAGALFVDGNEIHRNGFSAVSGSLGGGIYLNSGTGDEIDIRNNFIYKNQVDTGGGLYNANTNARIWHNTFINNVATNDDGAGIANLGGSPDIRNNIVDNNYGSNVYARTGTPTIDYNLIYNTFGYLDIDADGNANIGSDNITTGRPDYVYEYEEDYHLRQNSLGEDDGDPDVSDEVTNLNAVLIDFDQHPRPTNSGPDMGADEINSCLVKVGTQIFSVLQNAIDFAEDNDIPNVYIARGECRGVIDKNGTEQVAYISEDINLRGSRRRSDFGFPDDYNNFEVGTVSSIINAVGEGRTIHITNTAEVYFQQVALVNGNAFATDASSNNGGAVYNAGGTASFSESFICQSYAQNGAGYYGNASSVTDMTGTTIGRCRPAQVVEDPDGTVVSAPRITFWGSVAEGDGGGLYIDGSAEFRNIGLWYNSAGLSGSGNGGGIYNAGNDNRIVNGIVYSNTVPNNGAGIYNEGNNLRLLHNTIRENHAGGQGGGVYNSATGFEMNSSIIFENIAVTPNGGGGLYSTNGASLTHNNFNVNVPNESSEGTGTNPIVGDPGLVGIFALRVDSRNIDAAEPALLSEVNFDAGMKPRPDGTHYDYEPPRGIYADVGAYEYLMDFGCEVDPAYQEKPATPGDVLTYTVNIINTGNPPYTSDFYWLSSGYTDTITITVESQDQGWAMFEGGDVQTVELGWQHDYPYGESTSRVMTITVPLTATVGMDEVVNLKCQSASLTSRTGYGEVVAETGTQDGVTVVPNYFDTAVPGQVITYEQTVINLSNDFQTYRLTPSSGPRHASAVLLDSETFSPTNSITVTLAPTGTEGFTTTTYLEVTILDSATAGEIATPSVIATDIDDELVFGANRNEITILSVPGTRYVATVMDGGSDTTNCMDPLLPCATIQYAINQAVDGDEILVATGIYWDYTIRDVGEDSLYQNVFIDRPVTIRGGFDTGDGYTVQQPITNAVVLDAQGTRRGIYVADGVSATVSSLFIQNGNSGPVASNINGTTRDYGGGIYNVNGNLTITATWILTSEAKFGGGFYHANGDLLLNNSVFAGNTNLNPSGSVGVGAGLFISDGIAILENNTFVNNQAVNGGDSVIVGQGSAIYQAAGTTTLVNHIFQDNEAIGGESKYAVYITGTAVITNAYNLFYNQTSPINVGIGTGSNANGDPDFIDSYYHISASSEALDNGTASATYVRPDLLASGDYELESRVQGSRIDMGADERTQDPGFVFEPPILAETIDARMTVTYTHYLTNTGDFVDSYTLTMTNQVIPDSDPSWSWNFYPDTIADLGLGDYVTVTVVITGGDPGYQNITTIEAVSDSGLSASVQDTTTISQTGGVVIEQSESGSGVPGQLITYTHMVTNTGNGFDEITLTATAVPTDWVYTLAPAQPFFLDFDESAPVTVTVLIPVDALSSTQHQVVVTAMVSDPDDFDVLTDTTTVELVSGLTLTPDYTRDVVDGTSTIYTHTLTSENNITDTVALTVTGSLPSWVVSVFPESVDLDPYQSAIVSVTVNVPPNTGGLTHVAQVVATSQLPGITATATDTTTVPVDTGITFTPNLTEVVYAGNTAHYTHTLTNLGNLTDTFNIISDSVQGWILDVTDGPLTVGPDASVQVTAVIGVPPGTAPIDDILEITATSQSITTTTATVTDTTRVIQFVDLTFIPDHDETGDAGTTKVYTHTLTNDGDGSDTFDLTYSGVPLWTVMLEPSTSVSLNMGETAVITANLSIPSGASGYTNTTTITATSVYSPAISASVVNTTTVSGEQAQLGVLLEPDRSAIGNLNETITYYHTVTNTGTGPDDIGLSGVSPSGWTITVDPMEIIGLADGASAPVTVTVTIPGVAAPGEEDMAVITAVSQSDPSYSSSVTDTTRVLQDHGLLFYPDNAQSTAADTTIYYTHTLQNTGNGQDTFALTVDSQWTTAVDSPVTLDATESTTVYITLTVPAGTESQVDVMLITATSTISLSHSAVVSNTTTVTGVPPAANVEIEPDHIGYGSVGDVIAYVHTVTNTGTAADTFDIIVGSSMSWVTDIHPQPQVLNLDVGETGQVVVTVTIPADGLGMQDVTTVTVTSQTDTDITDFAVDSTYAPAIFLPIILKSDTSVPPTPTPTPTATPTETPTATATPPSCPTPTGKDLIVTEIRVEPAVPVANQSATVYVTIRNQGSVDVEYGNNFFLDFYVNQVPVYNEPGQIEWGVQGVLMQAGHSETFSHSYVFSGGVHQLWALVDTTNVVDECPFEDNNVLGPVSLTVTGSNLVDSDFITPTPLWNGEIRSTPTSEPRQASSSATVIQTPSLTATSTPTQTP